MSQSGTYGNANGLANVNLLAGNDMVKVGPDGTGTINVVGTAPLNITGNAGTNTLTVALATPLTVPNGGTGQSILTNHGLLVGAGTAAITQLGVASNGQIPIGSAGADPVLNTITAGSNITVTNGAGTITIAATVTTQPLAITSVNHGSSPYVVLTTDQFIKVDSSAGTVTIQLPNAPTTGQVWYIKDFKGTAFTNNITVTTVGGVVNIDGSTNFFMNTNFAAISVVFDGISYEIF